MRPNESSLTEPFHLRIPLQGSAQGLAGAQGTCVQYSELSVFLVMAQPV